MTETELRALIKARLRGWHSDLEHNLLPIPESLRELAALIDRRRANPNPSSKAA